MGFNITQIINKILPTKVSDSEIQENPFNTAVGQTVVSEEENFWARKLRYGNTYFAMWDNVSLPTPGTGVKAFEINPNVNRIFIPNTFSFGADTDCLVKIQYAPCEAYAPNALTGGLSTDYLVNTIVAAKTPFIFKFDGYVEISRGGKILCWVTPLTAAGKMYGTIHGVEVSVNA